ncbi:hypothetical protein K402DRAFT_461382 [Aulographum hederae CBS 113979]|uniref:Enoyl reductase (ER) domain-containing protein n=1 Tax=Aulographum hederae CBS 113979 TaxID=1176131 RepID=A0A6G1H7F9_9PEZI|nr:hypothetical protein K402DRAFT_461382 [Aulographum hederae CBS 113979]
MKALILDAEHKTAYVKDVDQPLSSPTEILIKVHAVALNPIDPLYVANPLGTTGRTVGSDFAGTIISLGSAVPPTSTLQPGDRVAGFLQGACSVNERPGAFAELLVCDWDLVWRVPDQMDLEQAASISLCGLTAAQALFYRLGLPAPWLSKESGIVSAEDTLAEAEPTYIFIYGASTSVALYAAQLIRASAKASGKKIILVGAASSKHTEMLKKKPYSYDQLVDYRDPTWPEQVRILIGGGGVHFAYDCISEGQTVENTAATLRDGVGKLAVVRSREGGAWSTTRPLPVEPSYGAVWEGLGREVQYQGMFLPASLAARAFAVQFYRWMSGGDGIQPNSIREMPGGLEKIVGDGFVLLGSGSMREREQTRRKEWTSASQVNTTLPPGGPTVAQQRFPSDGSNDIVSRDLGLLHGRSRARRTVHLADVAGGFDTPLVPSTITITHHRPLPKHNPTPSLLSTSIAFSPNFGPKLCNSRSLECTSVTFFTGYTAFASAASSTPAAPPPTTTTTISLAMRIFSCIRRNPSIPSAFSVAPSRGTPTAVMHGTGTGRGA